MNLSISAGRPRVYRIAVSAFFFISGLTFATWASRIPNIKTQLQLSDARLGAVLFALPAGLMISLFFAGWLVSRFGSRKVMIAAALFYPAILILLGLCGNVWQLAFVLFLFGLVSNLVNIAMNTQAVDVESMYGRSVMASFHGLWSIAGFSGAAIGTLLVSAGVTPWIHFSIIFITAVSLVLLFYKFTLPNDTDTAERQPFFVKPDRYILNLGLIAFCSMLCEGAMADWSGVYFQNIVKAPAAFITFGYVAFTAAMASAVSWEDGNKAWYEKKLLERYAYFYRFIYFNTFSLPGYSCYWFFISRIGCFIRGAAYLQPRWKIGYYATGTCPGSSFIYFVPGFFNRATINWIYCRSRRPAFVFCSDSSNRIVPGNTGKQGKREIK